MSLKSASFGGSGGAAFDDIDIGIAGMTIRSGNQVDSIQVTYRFSDGSKFDGPKHGGTGGSLNSFTLADDEMLIKMEGKTNGVLVDQVTFYSNKGKTYGPYGRTGETSFCVEGREIIAVFGRAGNLLDNLGVHYKK